MNNPTCVILSLYQFTALDVNARGTYLLEHGSYCPMAAMDPACGPDQVFNSSNEGTNFGEAYKARTWLNLA